MNYKVGRDKSPLNSVEQLVVPTNKKKTASAASLEAPPDVVLRINRDGKILEVLGLDDTFIQQWPGWQVGIYLRDLLTPDLVIEVETRVNEALSSRKALRISHCSLPELHMDECDVLITPSAADEVIITFADVTHTVIREEQVLRLNRTLLALQSAATSVSLSLDLVQILETFAWELTNLMNADVSAVYEWNQTANKLFAHDRARRE